MYCRTSACRLVPCREATCRAFSTSLSSTERVRFMHTFYVYTCIVSRPSLTGPISAQHVPGTWSASGFPCKANLDDLADAKGRERLVDLSSSDSLQLPRWDAGLSQ